MNILFLLIPIAALLVTVIVGGFIWAVKRDQFDDLETPKFRILKDDIYSNVKRKE
jgi:cbb3-type cytochrome oxidase maturation protein